MAGSMYRAFVYAVLAAVPAALTAVPVYAEQQYWVTVGSFQSADAAERVREQASAQLADSFTVVGAQTEKGYFYRVAAGPYTRDMARDSLAGARAGGYTQAWMWSDDASTFTTTGEFSTDFSTDYSSDYDLELPEYSTDLDSFDYDDTIPAEAELIDKREKPPEMVEEPPPGYKLNKMRRDALLFFIEEQPPPVAAVTPPATPDLAPPAAPASPSQPVAAPKPVAPDSAPPLVVAQAPIPISASSPIILPSYAESEVEIRIDGRLDEAVWQSNPGVDGFRVVDPDTVEKPFHRTLVRMLYTERGLYASFDAKQPPDTLVRVYSGRDNGGLNRDSVGVTIDTSGEGRYGYWVNLALGGNQADGTVLPERQFSGDWDGAWYGATQVTADGWTAEILIPWSQLAMPKEAGRRTVNAYASRKVAYRSERYAVPALPFTQPLFMSALQPLVVEKVDPRQQWSIFPYASVTQDEVKGYADTKIGADVFWRPSTNLQLTASVSPDFGNVESDDVIVNLSAFENFFPEKRLFFQEGIEVFNATPRAKGGNPVTALNTRRIGGRPRAPQVPEDVTVPSRELNQPTELLGAVKAVGQFGNLRYGLLSAFEDEAKFDADDGRNYYQDGRDYGVARFIYEDKSREGDYRALGTISTLASHPEKDAVVHGVDFHYLTAAGQWKVDGQLLRSDVDGTGVGRGGFVDVSHNIRRGLQVRWGLSHFDDQLALNDLGFLRRNDATNTSLKVNYNRSDLAWVRKIWVDAFAEYEMNSDGYKTKKGLGSWMGMDLHNRDQIRMRLAYFPERADDRNSRDNGTFLTEGRHTAYFDYLTDTAQRFSYRFGVGHDGEELGGNRYQGRFGVTWRPVDHINIGAFAQYQRRDGWLVWQEDRNFTTFESREWRPRLNFDYFLTAKQQLRFSAQWVGIKADEQEFYRVPERVDELERVTRPDDDSDDFAISSLNLQLRYRWEIAPLSELSVVYTLNGSEAASGGSFQDLLSDAYKDPVGEQLIVKLRYRLGT